MPPKVPGKAAKGVVEDTTAPAPVEETAPKEDTNKGPLFLFLTKNSLILFAKQFLQKLIEFWVAIYFTSVPVSNILPLLWRIDISSE